MKEGWSYKKLGEVARVIHGKNQKEVLSANGQYPIYGSGGTIMGYANDFLCEARTTILGRKGSINNPQFIEERFWNVDTAFGITALPGNNSKFIYYFIKSIDWSKKNTGTTLPSLTQQVVISVEIPVPPLSEQHSIVSRLDAAFSHIDALIANAEKQLNEARKLFQAELTECMKPKEGWEEKKIGDVFQTYAGGTPLKSGKGYYEGGTIPWIRSGEVCQMYIRDCEMCITEEGMKNSSAKYYPVDTILVAMYGATAAQVGILKFEATSNQAVCGILPHKDFIPEYIYYWFTNIQKDLAAQAQGGAQPNLSQVKIKKVSISYPSRTIQHSIVSHLDSLSSTIRKLEELQQKTLAECDALKQAMLREVLE
ncbi:MAG: restriction endonuclease subunit S [Bacteroidaceae bacterium]|nr:restriction endonuclease subunit S [Bacteroidaceae bacterium]